MPDEERFDRALRLAGNFGVVNCRLKIGHPTLPKAYVEVDNIAQRGKVVLVFEGKFTREADAVSQLKVRLQSLVLFKAKYISQGLLRDYDSIRLFSYSFKKANLTEYTSRGKKVCVHKFNDLNELALILRNI